MSDVPTDSFDLVAAFGRTEEAALVELCREFRIDTTNPDYWRCLALELARRYAPKFPLGSQPLTPEQLAAALSATKDKDNRGRKTTWTPIMKLLLLDYVELWKKVNARSKGLPKRTDREALQELHKKQNVFKDISVKSLENRLAQARRTRKIQEQQSLANALANALKQNSQK